MLYAHNTNCEKNDDFWVAAHPSFVGLLTTNAMTHGHGQLYVRSVL